MLARLAALASRSPRRVLAVALATTVVAGAFGADVASRLGGYGANDPASETSRTAVKLEAATEREVGDDIVVLVTDANRPKLERVSDVLELDPAVSRVTSLLNTRSPALVSRDRRSTYLIATFVRHVDGGAAVKRVQKRLAGVPGVTVGGGAVANTALNEVVQEDLLRAELIAFPLLFLLSFWFFRGLVAALLPPLVGGVSIAVTFSGLRLLNGPLDLSVFALNLVTGLGLGLAIDWSLFMVSRYREEIAAHGAGAEALLRTVSTAGRTVLFSALTVAAALASLLIFPQRFLYSMGVGGAMVALVGAVVALVVLPALLALLGERVNALAPRGLRRAAEREARGEERGGWYRLSQAVMRRPGRIAVACSVFLIALGAPALGIRFTSVDATVLPKAEPARVVAMAIERDFPAARTAPIVVAATGAEPAELAAWRDRVEALSGVADVSEPREAGPGLSRIDVTAKDGELDESTQNLVRAIRAVPAPFEVGVTGRTADFVDQKASLSAHIPTALAILAVTTLVILFLFTGSVVLPVKALVMNMLTLSAAFGFLVLVFQDGRFEGLLGYESQGALESSQPVVLFAVAFGLSTDYGVFLLSRIKEARDAGADNRSAVALGLQRTGRIVTAAAALFFVAIGAFALSRVVFIKEVGLGTAVAVLIDATIVRALLVPALMELLGRWNWWAPRPLRRLHDRIAARPAAPAATAP